MGVIIEDGLWRDAESAPDRSGRPALFLDRDGTVIEHVSYLAEPDGVVLIPAVVETIRHANRAGWAVVIVTNQSGVGRGYYDWEAFAAVQARVADLLAADGAAVDAVYAAGHAPADAGGPSGSPWRKPAPGMLLRAAAELGVELSASVMVGDGAHDLAAGKAAGLPRGWLVATGYGSDAREIDGARALAGDGFEVAVNADTVALFGAIAGRAS